MKVLQGFLVVGWIVLSFVSGRAITALGLEGANVFVTDFGHPWRAQFNTDFALWVVLVVAWIVWRHASWVVGVACGVAALAMGGMFLMPYLLLVSISAQGDVRRLLLGSHWPVTDH